MENIKLLESALDKYHLTSPVPPELQKHILANTKKNLVRLLKEAGWYSPFFALVLFFFFFLKRLGIHLSVAKTVIAVGVASAVSVAGVSSGVYVAVKNIVLEEAEKTEIHKDVNNIESAVIDVPDDKQYSPDVGEPNGLKSSKSIGTPEKTGSKPGEVVPGENSMDKSGRTEGPAVGAKNIISLRAFDNKGAEKDITALAFKTIRNELVRLRGSKTVVGSGEGGFFLTGSVEKIETIYMISVKVKNRTTKEYHYVGFKQSSSVTELKLVCREIAREISKKIK
ncbi:MAG: hypothetical protein GY754_13870 [bacterium]|nr:hypothetical protein [bacterium]